MSLWQDEKYVRLLSTRLDQFKDKGRHQFNFRCPLCGDSEKKKNKARGYLFPVRDALLFKCHNCSISMPFSALLKRIDLALYGDYMTERFREEGQRQNTPLVEKRVTETVDIRTHFDPALVPKVFGCDIEPVLDFCARRKFSAYAMTRLHATTQARTWLEPLVGEKAKTLKDGDVFLVQPLTLPNGVWYGAQLRNLDQKMFSTFRWSHQPLKMFGLDLWKPAELTYVVEGPLDALFVPNAIAACGSDLLSAADNLTQTLSVAPDWTGHAVFVWDNEPHNKDVAKHIQHAIWRGLKVVIWPYYHLDHEHFPKDINDMVRAGIDVRAKMRDRTMSGLAAQTAFDDWLKSCKSELFNDTLSPRTNSARDRWTPPLR